MYEVTSSANADPDANVFIFKSADTDADVCKQSFYFRNIYLKKDSPLSIKTGDH